MISSTVGLEALLYEQARADPGQPFYAGFGITLDVDSFAEIRERVPELLALPARPGADRAFLARRHARLLPGAPVLVDRSEENALTVADTFERAATAATFRRPVETSVG